MAKTFVKKLQEKLDHYGERVNALINLEEDEDFDKLDENSKMEDDIYSVIYKEIERRLNNLNYDLIETDRYWGPKECGIAVSYEGRPCHSSPEEEFKIVINRGEELNPELIEKRITEEFSTIENKTC